MTMTRRIKAGTTDVSVTIRIIDSTDGTPETGVVWDTSGIDLEYRREGAASTDITEATLAALTTAHADGGFLHIGNGYYRLDLPDAACAAGVTGVLVHGTVTGMVVIGCYIELVAYDPYDSVRLGLTALPNAAADAAGGLPISDAGELDLDARLDAAVSSRLATAGYTTPPTAAQNSDAVWDEAFGDHNTEDTFGNVLNDLIDENGGDGQYQFNQHALALAPLAGTPPTVGAIADAVWDEARSGHVEIGSFGQGAASVQGNVTGSVLGSVASISTGGITVGSFASGAISNLALATGALTADALAADAVTEIQAGLSTLNAAGVRSAVGLASANLDTQLAAIDDAIDTEVEAILSDTNELQTDWMNGGRLDLLIDAIKAVGDKLNTALELDGAVYRYTTNALEQAPTGGAAPTVEEIRQEMDANSTQLAAIAGYLDTEIAAILAAVDTEVAAILADTNELQTDWVNGGRLDLLIDAIIAAVALIPTAAENAASTLDEVVEGATTLRQLLRGYTAALMGKSSDHESGTPKYRDLADTTDRIDAVVDENGNRLSVALDLT